MDINFMGLHLTMQIEEVETNNMTVYDRKNLIEVAWFVIVTNNNV